MPRSLPFVWTGGRCERPQSPIAPTVRARSAERAACVCSGSARMCLFLGGVAKCGGAETELRTPHSTLRPTTDGVAGPCQVRVKYVVFAGFHERVLFNIFFLACFHESLLISISFCFSCLMAMALA